MKFQFVCFILCSSILACTSSGQKLTTRTEVSLSNNQSQFNEDQDAFDWLASKINRSMQQHNIPALSIAVLLDGELVYSKGFGIKDRKHRDTVTSSSIYQLASLTKMFTGIVANNLIVAGKLDPNKSIITYLPEISSQKTRQTISKITVKNLLNHESGLPRNNPSDTRGWAEPMRGLSKERLLADLNGIQLAFEPGTNFGYSGFGYGLLGLICENVSGLEYSELIEKYIAEKYNLPNTFIYPNAKQDQMIPTPYDPHNRNKKTSRWEMGKRTPSGGAFSNVIDLAKLMTEQMRVYTKFKANGQRDILILTDETTGNGGYGFGFVKTVKEYGTFYNHRGDMSGFASSYIFRQEDNFGLILLTSSGGPWFQQLEDDMLKKFLDF